MAVIEDCFSPDLDMAVRREEALVGKGLVLARMSVSLDEYHWQHEARIVVANFPIPDSKQSNGHDDLHGVTP